MTMRRGGKTVREREALRAAMARLRFACPDCPTTKYRIEWNGTRYIVVIWHDPACQVLKTDNAVRSCNEFMINAIRYRAGLAVPEYDMDGPFISHRV